MASQPRFRGPREELAWIVRRLDALQRGVASGSSGGGGSRVAVSDEGSPLTSAAASLDFAGGGVEATNVGSAVTVTIPGGLFGTGVDQSGPNANAGGDSTVATGTDSFAVGNGSTASGDNSAAFGTSSTASGSSSFAAGNIARAEGEDAVAFNNGRAAGQASYSDGQSYAQGDFSHAESNAGTGPSAQYAHAEGGGFASGSYSHAEGEDTIASGEASHAEGVSTTASNQYTHAEGNNTTASGDTSHAEGDSTIASGYASHAQGILAHAFRTGEHATATRDNKVLQHSEICITNDWGTSDVNIGGGTDPIEIPVHDGHFDAKVTLYLGDLESRWDITFRGSNDATDFAGRPSGTVTIDASAGGSALVYGSSAITWAVSGDSAGNVLITPSATTGSTDRYAHVDLFELHANT